MTARRDLHELERRGLAHRTHGGAVLPTAAAHEDSFDRRVKTAATAKELLAAAAIGLLKPHETIFLDSSTTSYFVARRLIAPATVAPLFFGWMAVQGVGLGLYDGAFAAGGGPGG